jgi:meso-butanediol dehydrogenase / (S,S)-butanediol dehydrogenase / diacetyl reductase
MVTGAGHGIGRACAHRLAGEGARVVVADLDLDAATRVVAELPARPASVHLALAIDITSTAAVEAAVEQAVQHLGGLDVLVNVAGGDTAHGTFENTDDQVWVQMLELNLMGVVRCCRAAIPHLRQSSHGAAIVSVSSVNALAALGSEPYSAAKLGVVALTRNLAADLGPSNIRVNAVAPGTIRTRVWEDQEGGADRLRALYPLGRVGEPEDVAAAVAFLASRDAGWITGHTLPVDGGLLTGYRQL